MNLNDIIKHVLLEVSETRNSSKLLIWEVYKYLGIIELGHLSMDYFMEHNTPHPSTIVRRARLIQKEDKYKPTVDKPYRRRAPKDEWIFSNNVDVHVWQRYK